MELVAIWLFGSLLKERGKNSKEAMLPQESSRQKNMVC
jgi:hypothetical protein